jgi:uncharacterized protein with PhoU and TrkA domain
VKPPAASPEVMDRSAEHDLAELGMNVERFIARVLRRAYLAALAVGEPDQARAILDVAQSFADELASADAGFDRLAFVAAVTEDGS